MAVNAVGGVPRHQDLADLEVDAHPQYPTLEVGTLATRPDPGTGRARRMYVATDGKPVLYVDVGDQWVVAGGGGSNPLISSLTPGGTAPATGRATGSVTAAAGVTTMTTAPTGTTRLLRTLTLANTTSLSTPGYVTVAVAGVVYGVFSILPLTSIVLDLAVPLATSETVTITVVAQQSTTSISYVLSWTDELAAPEVVRYQAATSGVTSVTVGPSTVPAAYTLHAVHVAPLAQAGGGRLRLLLGGVVLSYLTFGNDGVTLLLPAMHVPAGAGNALTVDLLSGFEAAVTAVGSTL